MDNEIKVFRMNDYEWWATRWDAEETNDWYNKNIADNDIEEVELSDLDKNGVWYLTEDPKDFEKLGDSDELISFEIVNGQHRKKAKFGDLMRQGYEIYKYISFRDAIQFDLNFTEPYCLASTEW